jgi:hypothetical protein
MTGDFVRFLRKLFLWQKLLSSLFYSCPAHGAKIQSLPNNFGSQILERLEDVHHARMGS